MKYLLLISCLFLIKVALIGATFCDDYELKEARSRGYGYRYEESSFKIEETPKKYFECYSFGLRCSVYGAVDMSHHLGQLINKYQQNTFRDTCVEIDQKSVTAREMAPAYGRGARPTTNTIDKKAKDDQDAEKSESLSVPFPKEVLKLGRNAKAMSLSLNSSLEPNAISGFPKLQELHLARFSSLSSKSISGLKKLELISFDSLDVPVLPKNVLYNAPKTGLIDIQNSKVGILESLAFFSLYNVEKLYMSNVTIGHIEDYPFVGMLRLQYLTITNSNLTEINSTSFAFLPNLKELNLAYNQIAVVGESAFGNLTRLEVLDLSYNKLMEINAELFQGLQSLETLNLAHNEIATLGDMPFDLPKLRKFDLSYNAIENISMDSFIGLTALRTVDLTANNITAFEMSNATDIPFDLKMTVAFMSQPHYESLKSMSDERCEESAIDFSTFLMKQVKCQCNWTWINDEPMNEKDYMTIATKQCSEAKDSDSDQVLLYQYLYTECDSYPNQLLPEPEKEEENQKQVAEAQKQVSEAVVQSPQLVLTNWGSPFFQRNYK